MKIVRNILISLVAILISAPMVLGQDLSGYQKFSLGTSLAEVSKQVGPYSHKTTLVHHRPAVIQELTFWPLNSSSSVRLDPVSQILFSFYNGELYRIVVTYEQDATAGLTEDDMVRAMSVQYGTATRFYPEINFPTNDLYDSTEKVIARWGNSQNSITFFRSSNLTSFQLAVFSNRLDAQAKAAITESVKVENEGAPQKEIDRQKKEADNLEVVRQKNVETFRP